MWELSAALAGVVLIAASFGVLGVHRIVARVQVMGHRQIPTIQQLPATTNRAPRRSSPTTPPPPARTAQVGVVVATAAWAPTPSEATLSAVPGLLGGGTVNVSLRLTGVLGTVKVSEVFIDPQGRG